MRLVEVIRRNRRDVQDFLRLPFRLYRNIPQWVPPLMPGERARFRDDYPFYRHSQAAFFLVRDEDGQAVGRVAVHNSRPHNEYKKQNNAFVYLYEAIDDDRVARLLFEAAEQWGRQQGLDRLVGQKGFLTGDGLGLLVEGFEHRPAFGIPYNPPYYVRQWEAIGGMTKEIDYLSARAARATFQYPQHLRELAARLRERRGFHVPTFRSAAEIRRHIPALQRAYNAAFADLWSYTPIPDRELEAIFNRLFIVALPSMIKLVFMGDEVIGFQLAYPDVSAALQRQRGELWPFGWIDLLLEKRRTRWININGNAILPQYQGLGANAILYDEMVRTLLDSTHYDFADLVQVQESNFRMLGDLQKVMPLDAYKRHRIYQKALA